MANGQALEQIVSGYVEYFWWYLGHSCWRFYNIICISLMTLFIFTSCNDTEIDVNIAKFLLSTNFFLSQSSNIATAVPSSYESDKLFVARQPFHCCQRYLIKRRCSLSLDSNHIRHKAVSWSTELGAGGNWGALALHRHRPILTPNSNRLKTADLAFLASHPHIRF